MSARRQACRRLPAGLAAGDRGPRQATKPHPPATAALDLSAQRSSLARARTPCRSVVRRPGCRIVL